MKERLIVIGNGMAGARFVEELLARNGRERYDIVMFGDEPCLAVEGLQHFVALHRVERRATRADAVPYLTTHVRICAGRPGALARTTCRPGRVCTIAGALVLSVRAATRRPSAL